MRKQQSGFGVVPIILIAAVLGAAGFAGWYVWNKQQDKKRIDAISSFDECGKYYPVMESYPARCATPDGRSFTQAVENPDGLKPPVESKPEQKYLTIKEWGVRIPISDATNSADMTYRYVKNDSYESAFFTFQRLVDKGMCKEDIGVALSRSKTQTAPPYNIDNPEQFKKVGDYYYSFAYGHSYCYDADDPAEVAFYEGTKITKNTVTDAVKNLELVSTQ